MKIYSGGIGTATGLNISAPTPSDDRFVVDTFSGLAGLTYKYDGLITKVQDVNKTYQYDLATDSWVLFGGDPTGFVPYSGATQDVNLGNKIFQADRIYVTNNALPASGQTGTIFGVYGDSATTAANRSLYVGRDSTNRMFVNNAGGGNPNNSTAFGVNVLSKNTTGLRNTGFGYFSLSENLTGMRNTAFGYQALAKAVIASGNTAIGNSIMNNHVSGNNNTWIGVATTNNAAFNVTTGSFNTILGGDVTLVGGELSASNQIIIADGQGNRAFQKNAAGTVNIQGTSLTFNGLPIAGASGGTQGLQSVLNQGSSATTPSIRVNAKSIILADSGSTITTTPVTTSLAIIGGENNIIKPLTVGNQFATYGGGIFGASNSSIISDNDYFSSIFGGVSHIMSGTSHQQSTIIGGSNSKIGYGSSTTIIGGNNHNIQFGSSSDDSSTIIGGNNNRIGGLGSNSSYYNGIFNSNDTIISGDMYLNTVVGGSDNQILGNTTNNGLFNTYNALLSGSNIYQNTVIGGYGSSMVGPNITDNIMLGRSNNINSDNAYSNVILGSNNSFTSSGNGTTYNYLLGDGNYFFDGSSENYGVGAGNYVRGTYSNFIGQDNYIDAGTYGVNLFGSSNQVSGDNQSTIVGHQNSSNTLGSITNIFGNANQNYSNESTTIGRFNTNRGDLSLVIGYGNIGRIYGETVIGNNAIDYSGTSTASTSTYLSADTAFRVGIGSVDLNRRDGLRIFKSGLITAPSVTNALIAAGDAKTLVTKEYLTAAITGATSGGTATWGNISGTLSGQTDLQNALNLKFNIPTGTTTQYVSGNGTLRIFQDDVRVTTLTGLSLVNSAITSTDSVLSAFGKAQAQLNSMSGQTADIANKVNRSGDTMTGALNLAAATSGLTLYNTTDQITNYERLAIKWNNNSASITTENGGTGTTRTLVMGVAGASQLSINNTGGVAGYIRAARSLTVNNQTMFATGAGVSTNGTAGNSNVHAIFPNVNQSGTAGYRGLWISANETSLGTGTKYLIDAGTNTALDGGGTYSSVFNVDNVGSIRGLGLFNLATQNNSAIRMQDIGTSITRNIADSNSTLIVNNVNAANTGQILILQSAGSNVLQVDNTGALKAKSIENLSTASNAQLSLTTTGLVATRNIADGNAILSIANLNTGSTGALLNMIAGGSSVAYFGPDGGFRGPYLSNTASFSNGAVQLTNVGVIITRNIADANNGLVVNLANTGATGAITAFQKGSVTQSYIAGDGTFRGLGFANFTATNNSLFRAADTGGVITRNVADSNTALIINQANTGSTGVVLDVQFAGNSVFKVDRFGKGAFNSTVGGANGVASNDFVTVQQLSDAQNNSIRTGVSTQSGNGTSMVFTIAHGLGALPSYANAVAQNLATANIAFITYDATNIYVNFTVAPAIGTNNLKFNWMVKS